MGVKDSAIAGEKVSKGMAQKYGGGLQNASPKDSNMSHKAIGTPKKGGSNNIMDVAAHDTSKNGASMSGGSKGGM